MYKPDDKDIDRVSRDAAEHYHAPGRPSWDALQQILDKELPQQKERKRRGFFFFFFVALGLSVAGTGVWYALTINNSNNKRTLTDIDALQNGAATKASPSAVTPTEAAGTAANTDKKNKAVSAATTAAGSQPSADPNGAGQPATRQTARKADPVSSAGIPLKQPSADEGLTGSHSLKGITVTSNRNNTAYRQTGTHGRIIAARNRNNDDNNGALPSDERDRVGKKRLSKNTAGLQTPVGKKQSTGVGDSDEPESTATLQNKQKEIAATAQENENDEAVVSDNTKNPVAADTLTTAAGQTIAAATPPSPKDSTMSSSKKPVKKRDRAINIGVTAGIDESTVKFTHGDNVGYNVGIMGGYQFSKHWAVYTGLVYTKKNYTLNGEDYHPPKHYWTQYVQLDKVDGYCRMWELPLQARYTFNPSARTPAFVSAGLSSYFMKKQAYTYDYKTMNMPYSAGWSTDSTFTHVFSILHLSAGIEKSIGKHMNFQIEPYAKIPLGGVGFGNIRLSSFGVNFTVQYRQPVKR